MSEAPVTWRKCTGVAYLDRRVERPLISGIAVLGSL